MKAVPLVGVVAGLLMLAHPGQTQPVADETPPTINVPTRAEPQSPQHGPAATITPRVENSPAAQGPRVQNQAGQNRGGTCREAMTTVIIGGQPQQAYGQACQGPDGSWKFVR
jgi:hypothetical protein